MKNREEFEKWFLKHDVRKSDLDKVKRGDEYVYFYTTTKMLFDQFVKAKCMDLIIELSTDEMDFVTIHHPNPEFDEDDRNYAVSAGGGYSDQQPLLSYGDNLLNALSEAAVNMREEKSK